MDKLSRRHFLKQLGAFGLLSLVGRSAFPVQIFDSPEAFELLVVGDSLVWGQGLKEEQKFYTLTKQWLEREVFLSQNRAVNLKVKAHSGSRLTFHDDEAAIFRRAKRDERKYLHSEINVSFPSIKTQIDIARSEYQAENKNAASVKLIMLSGGITDISVSEALNPFRSNKKLRRDIARFCHASMLDVLEHSAQNFPNALIVVVGYFPIISPKMPSGKMFNAMLEAFGFPRPLKPLANNILTRQMFKIIRRATIKRSRIWAETSDANLQKAVNELNDKLAQKRAVFVKTPITEENCLGAKDSMLFKMGKNGRIEDELYDERKKVCKPSLKELSASTKLKYSARFCEIAAIGHPNAAGSKAYAEAIKKTLEPILRNNPRAVLIK